MTCKGFFFLYLFIYLFIYNPWLLSVRVKPYVRHYIHLNILVVDLYMLLHVLASASCQVVGMSNGLPGNCDWVMGSMSAIPDQTPTTVPIVPYITNQTPSDYSRCL